MPERTFDAKPVLVDYECDKCKQGTMRFTAEMLSRGQYQHQCTHCGDTQTFTTIYPGTRWEAIVDTVRYKELPPDA